MQNRWLVLVAACACASQRNERSDGGDDAAHAARRNEGSKIVHDIVDAMGGSISAEHGLGALKTDEALRYKAPVEVAALRAIRSSLVISSASK